MLSHSLFLPLLHIEVKESKVKETYLALGIEDGEVCNCPYIYFKDQVRLYPCFFSEPKYFNGNHYRLHRIKKKQISHCSHKNVHFCWFLKLNISLTSLPHQHSTLASVHQDFVSFPIENRKDYCVNTMEILGLNSPINQVNEKYLTISMG